ncbi:hypothetical protein [Nostoc sp.]
MSNVFDLACYYHSWFAKKMSFEDRPIQAIAFFGKVTVKNKGKCLT